MLTKVFLMHRPEVSAALLLSAGLGLLAGCNSRPAALATAPTGYIADANAADVVRAAQTVLDRMHFPIEKADPEAGIIRTAPLPAAQFFELWRSDNVSFSDAVAANVHTIRRSVEVNVSGDPGRVFAHCTVRVQRLSLPGQAIPSVSQTYRVHSSSHPDLQTFVLTPEQEAAMAWIDLDDDEQLAAQILQRIERQLAQQKRKEAS